MVPQLPRSQFGIHKQPMILTITLCCLSERNAGILLGREKATEGSLRKDIPHPKPTIHVGCVSKYEAGPGYENGVWAQAGSGP